MRSRIAVAFSCWLFIGSGAFAQSAVRVHVHDERGRPVPNALLTVLGAGQVVRSDLWGWASVEVRDSAKVLIQRLGYDSLTFLLRLSDDPREIAVWSRTVLLPGVRTTFAPGEPTTLSMSRESVAQLPPLGEPDIMRALPFLAGVSQPDDRRSAIYLAGAASDETAVELDGFPLLPSPHFLGAFSPVGVSALDGADVMIFDAPASDLVANGGTVRLRSRYPSTKPARQVDLGLLTAGATTAQRLSSHTSLLLSGRSTYADALHGVTASGADDAALPTYSDAIGRVDFAPGPDVTASLLGYMSRDARGGPPFVARQTLIGSSIDWHGTELRVGTTQWVGNQHASSMILPTAADLSHRWSNAQIKRTFTATRVTTSLSVRLDDRRLDYDWNQANSSAQVFGPFAPAALRARETQDVGAIGIDVQMPLSRMSDVTIGTRTSTVGGRVYSAPRFSARFFSDTTWSAALSVNRRYQFDGTISPGAELSDAQPVFLLNQPRRMDVVSMPIRARGLGRAMPAITLEVTPFLRWFANRPVLAPQTTSSGAQVDSEVAVAGIPGFSRVSARSKGVAVSAGMDLGSARGFQLSYTLARTEQKFSDGWHPSSFDATHVVAIVGAARLFRSWSLTGAWQWRSGLPATPMDSRVFYSLPFSAGVVPRIVYGPTNSGRFSDFNRADVGVRRSWGVKREWTLSAQLINVLYSQGAVSYRPGDFLDALIHGVDPLPAEKSLPLIPTIGLQVRW